MRWEGLLSCPVRGEGPQPYPSHNLRGEGHCPGKATHAGASHPRCCWVTPPRAGPRQLQWGVTAAQHHLQRNSLCQSTPPQLQGERDHPGAPTFCQAFQRAQPPAAPIVSVGMMGPFPLLVQAPCRLWQAVLHKVSLTPSRLEPCHCPCQWRWWCINMRLASCIIICRAGARLALHTRGEP